MKIVQKPEKKKKIGRNNIEKYQLVWNNFVRMELWWYPKVQFVFNEENYKSTNKYIRLFLVVAWVVGNMGNFVACIKEVRSMAKLSSSFVGSNNFLANKFNIFPAKASESMYKNIVWCGERNVTDINAIFLVFWSTLSRMLKLQSEMNRCMVESVTWSAAKILLWSLFFCHSTIQQRLWRIYFFFSSQM